MTTLLQRMHDELVRRTRPRPRFGPTYTPSARVSVTIADVASISSARPRSGVTTPTSFERGSSPSARGTARGGLPALESTRVDVVTATKERSEQRDLLLRGGRLLDGRWIVIHRRALTIASGAESPSPPTSNRRPAQTPARSRSPVSHRGVALGRRSRRRMLTRPRERRFVAREPATIDRGRAPEFTLSASRVPERRT